MTANENDEIIEVLRSDYNSLFSYGFWIGAISGLMGTFLLCLMAGLFIK